MGELISKVAYLKGLADGLKLDESKEETKLLKKLIDVVGDLAEELSAVSASCEELDESLLEVDEDLADLEDFVYGDEDEDDGDDDCLFDNEDDEYFEIECPNCHEDVLVDFDLLDEDHGIVCPNCHEEIELDFDCDCDDGDCDCGCGHDDE